MSKTKTQQNLKFELQVFFFEKWSALIPELHGSTSFGIRPSGGPARSGTSGSDSGTQRMIIKWHNRCPLSTMGTFFFVFSK